MPASDAPAVTRNTLRQQIADALRDEILSGRLTPGQEFTVKEIADGYGVSATPVREALVDLTAQGLLDSAQHRGFRVHEYSLADHRAMIEARSLVADGIFRGLAENAPEDPGTFEALAGVRRRGEEAARAATAGDLNVLIGYDLRFWRELSALFGNPYLSDFFHRLRVQSWMYTVPHLRRAGDLKGSLWAGHCELVDALAARDPRRAHAIIAAYNADSLALVERLTGAGSR
ncbi:MULTISPECIES: GntR family transcriptional regulator [unclassified Streptomyces]|uniref:GntR family transcriptional regulator n=1 Tax=unclassified Streptomyces TaxID=2593676 RepID=UPI000DBA624A|nr:GntR family transcriptional regulator [Streptomyces sp. PsTaAH-137]MYT69957.1 GntR family transcriptional regulator [Streptomyces sp. SID8367]RAJ88530.1 DNA-binding GntR family transcriptional regulator [Streptomyces sp. PsTaAH-137]